MRLNCRERILLPDQPAKKIIVVLEQPHAGVELHDPISEHRLREPQLRLECPAVRAEVDELRAIVLADGSADADAGTHGRAPPAHRQFLRCQRRTAQEIHTETKRRISKPGTIHALAHVLDITRHMGPCVRDCQRYGAQTSEEPERPPVVGRHRVHARMNVVDGQRRIGDDSPGRVQEPHTHKIETHRRRRVRARFELLRVRGACAAQKHRENGSCGAALPGTWTFDHINALRSDSKNPRPGPALKRSLVPTPSRLLPHVPPTRRGTWCAHAPRSGCGMSANALPCGLHKPAMANCAPLGFSGKRVAVSPLAVQYTTATPSPFSRCARTVSLDVTKRPSPCARGIGSGSPGRSSMKSVKTHLAGPFFT